ncbi:hypothetical protein OG730_42300 (plasmid) [Streptomyces sp. NBC_01298]|uniref:hypothetical protein n=1 Tax=Streptomyces sp. NBC_01298 TaxID=2903817 RepID=UPI002E0F5977|nr:hypothetical protein OG730_42300 [Streptomyces sp. NBC_01298]
MAPYATTSPSPHLHPNEVAEFERIWRGEAGGMSEAAIRKQHARHMKVLRDLRSDAIRPTAVIPTRLHTKAQQAQIAVDSVAALIRQDEEALATRGRSVLENRGLVRRRTRAARGPITDGAPARA